MISVRAALGLAAALALWAVIHSLLASARTKTVVLKFLGERVFRGYRLFYNLLAVISLIPVAVLARILPDALLYRVAAPWSYAMLGGQALAAILLLVALLQTGPLWFAGLAQLLRRQSAAGLTTSGLYGLVRHPLYLFGLLILWLAPIMTINQLTITTVVTAYCFIGAALEERRLVREFGDAYIQYARHTPMIIPWLPLAQGRRASRADS